jgi:hypothetical protein
MEKPWVWGLRERGGFKGFFWRCYVLKSKTVAMGGEMEKVLVGFWFRVFMDKNGFRVWVLVQTRQTFNYV